MKIPSLQKPENMILYFSLIHTVFSLLVGSYEAIMVFKLTGSFTTYISLNLVLFVFLFLGFIIGLYNTRGGKITRNFKLDLSFQVLISLYVIILFPMLSSFWTLVPIFLLKGLSEGYYWSTRNVSLIACIPDKSRDSWMMKLQTALLILSILLPFISGFAITHIKLPDSFMNDLLTNGYIPIYATAGLISLFGIILGPKLKIEAQTMAPSKILSLYKKERLGSYQYFLILAAIGGGVVPVLTNYLNQIILRDELSLGLFGSLIGILSTIFFFSLIFITRKKTLSRTGMILLGVGGETISRTIFYFFLNLPGLIGKSIIDAFIVPLKGLFAENLIRVKVERLSGKHSLSLCEVLAYQESFVFIGRVIFLGLLLIGAAFVSDAVSFAQLILFVCIISGLIEYLFLRNIEKSTREQP